MRKSIILSTLLVVSMILSACGGQDEGSKGGESVTWIANSGYPEGNHLGQAVIQYGDKVSEVTDGQIEIELRADGALGYEGSELLKVVRDNTVTMSDMVLSSVSGDEPLFGLSTLPFLYRDFDEAKTLNEIARPYYDTVAEEKWNQKILYVIPWPISGFWTKNEITSLDDMKGLKMRTYDAMGAQVVEAVGGTPYPLPFSEVYSGLSTGVIDSVLTSTTSAVDGKFWEVLDYYLPISVMMGTNALTVNLDEFKKLDQETQDAILKAGKEIEDDVWSRVAEIDAKAEETTTENGITTVEPSEELVSELETITEEIRQNWLKTAPAEAQEIIDKYYEAIGRE